MFKPSRDGLKWMGGSGGNPEPRLEDREGMARYGVIFISKAFCAGLGSGECAKSVVSWVGMEMALRPQTLQFLGLLVAVWMERVPYPPPIPSSLQNRSCSPGTSLQGRTEQSCGDTDCGM